MPASKDLKKLVARIEHAGWDIKRISNGHYRVRPPEGYGAQMFLSTMAGDIHTYQNMRQRLKRAGFFEYESAYLRRDGRSLTSDLPLIDVPLPEPLPLPVEETSMRPAPRPAPATVPATTPERPAAPPAPAAPAGPLAAAPAERVKAKPDAFAVGLVKLGKQLARLPLDEKALNAVRALVSYAEELGLTLADVRGVLEVSDD